MCACEGWHECAPLVACFRFVLSHPCVSSACCAMPNCCLRAVAVSTVHTPHCLWCGVLHMMHVCHQHCAQMQGCCTHVAVAARNEWWVPRAMSVGCKACNLQGFAALLSEGTRQMNRQNFTAPVPEGTRRVNRQEITAPVSDEQTTFHGSYS